MHLRRFFLNTVLTLFSHLSEIEKQGRKTFICDNWRMSNSSKEDLKILFTDLDECNLHIYCDVYLLFLISRHFNKHILMKKKYIREMLILRAWAKRKKAYTGKKILQNKNKNKKKKPLL